MSNSPIGIFNLENTIIKSRRSTMFRFTAFVSFVLLFTTPIFSTIINVPGDQPSIQAGITAATDADTVLVADSTYYENINFKGKKITVASLFIIDGDTNHINNTIIDGSQPSYPDSGSVVYFASGEDTTSILCGFTITGGSGTIIVPGIVRGSGGIHCSNSGPRICHNRIINNSVTSTFYEALGGGIGAGPLTSNAFIVVEDNLIQSNTTMGDEFAFGGGIFLTINARISGNRILDNIASAENQQAWGGGIGTESADSVIVTGNIVLRNKAQTNSNTELADGGGMFFLKDSAAFVRIIGNSVAYNEIKSNAFQGGAGVGIDQIGYSGGDVLFANNLIYKNKYTGLETCHGGGLYLNRSIVKVINNTITRNTASFGGGISCSHSDSTTLFMNNICWDDTATQSPGEIDLYFSSPPSFVYNDIQGGWTGEGNIDTDPLFADTLDYKLSNSSPCIGTGIDSIQIGGIWYHSPPTDIVGNPRPMPAGTMPDMGVWEDLVTGLNEWHQGILSMYWLYQNYPNPFNPITTIEFSLPNAEFVTLKIYNILGGEVATLVSERLTVGKYNYDWDASGLASGVYLYRIQAGDYFDVKKMVLMR
jgi:hypothetical protein